MLKGHHSPLIQLNRNIFIVLKAMLNMEKLIAASFILFMSINKVYTNPIVNTKYGPIEGISVPIHTGQIIDSYIAFPYFCEKGTEGE